MGFGLDIRIDMSNLSIFCSSITHWLIKFCEDRRSHADLWIRVRGAINFLDLFSESKKGPPGYFSKYGFRGDMNRLTYEQMIVTKKFLKERGKRACETRKRLPLIIDLRLSPGQRRKAAGYCIKLFSDLQIYYYYYSYFPPTIGTPRDIQELLLEGNGKKSKRAVQPKTAGKSEGKK
jgi:hypothetical protein